MVREVKSAKANSPSRCHRHATPAWSSSAVSARPGPCVWSRRGRAAMTARSAGWRFSSLGAALKGVDFYSNLEVIYWLHQSRRDLVLQSPKNNEIPRHLLAALAGAAEPDRYLDRQACRDGSQTVLCAASIASTDAAPRHQARPLRIHPAGATAGRRFRDGVRLRSPDGASEIREF